MTPRRTRGDTPVNLTLRHATLPGGRTDSTRVATQLMTQLDQRNMPGRKLCHLEPRERGNALSLSPPPPRVGAGRAAAAVVGRAYLLRTAVALGRLSTGNGFSNALSAISWQLVALVCTPRPL